jgi:hypothetical protein
VIAAGNAFGLFAVTAMRSEGTRPSKGENEPVAAIFKGVTHQRSMVFSRPFGIVEAIWCAVATWRWRIKQRG